MKDTQISENGRIVPDFISSVKIEPNCDYQPVAAGWSNLCIEMDTWIPMILQDSWDFSNISEN